MELKRKDGESDFAYKERLIVAKLDKEIDLDWSDIAELLGEDCHPDHLRKTAYGIYESYQYRLQSSIDITGQDIIDTIEAKKIELQKERYKLNDQRVAFNKMVRQKARQEEINEILEKCIAEGNLPKLEVSTKVPVKSSNKSMLVSLNDLHYGQDITNSWNVYNSTICERRLAEYLYRIVEIQAEQKASECIVWANGDLISGNIHNEISVTNKENVIEQIMQVSELIASFLCYLSGYFNTIKFVSVSGNHSRIGKKEDALKDERLDDLVEWYLKARLRGINNIKFDEYEKIDTTAYVVKVQGLNYIGVHGDYDYSASSIQNLVSMIGKPIYGILSGHLHHNKIDTVQGIKTIMGGSMIGMDSYCVQKRILGVPEQIVCICTNEGLKCSYNVELKQ